MVAARAPHASLGPLLAAAGVPAVLAMQGRISMVAELAAAKAAAARRALVLVLQLCTEEPDIDGVPGGAAAPTRNGFAPVPVERITITADKSRITVESYDATESFRSAGCIEVQLIDPQGIELACATDKSTCTLEWTHKEDQRLDLCIWDPAHADERIQKGHHHRLRSRARASLISSCAKNSALMWASVSSDLSVTPTTTLMSGKKTR